MRLLDLFCGAGGCSVGYYRAGFTEIVGVDINPQKRYPFEFVQADSLEFIAKHGQEFDLIHASPPCQTYSVTKSVYKGEHIDLVHPTRELLHQIGQPYVIENVPGAPLVNPIMLCGTMFNLRVIRHRLFETKPILWWPPVPCSHWGKTAGKKLTEKGKRQKQSLRIGDFITVTGSAFIVADAQIAMDIDWMTGKELSQAIPPAYTEWLGKEILKLIA